MTDYRVIVVKEAEKLRMLSLLDVKAMYKTAVKFLTDNIELAQRNNERVVVLTHHSPTIDFGHEEPSGAYRLGLRTAFGSDLTDLLGPRVHTWCYGHTHWYVVCNKERESEKEGERQSVLLVSI
jgi:hypothetical protein